jgi:hypothetical protein
LYTSDTDRPSRGGRAGKAALVYLGFSGFCIFFDRVYALFGHGVFSANMSLMFLYPLLGGALPFFLLWRFLPRSEAAGGRVWFNCYSSGIAARLRLAACCGACSILRGPLPPTAQFFRYAAGPWSGRARHFSFPRFYDPA